MHLHILGICGTFMGGIAALARQAGHTVTGSDAGAYPPMSEQLAALDIEVLQGYDPAHLKPAPDCVIVGNVMSRGNPAVEYLLNSNIPYASGPEWLAANILRDQWVLAVAGTHGKTSTSSMLAWILDYAGLAPGFLIGGVPADFACSARSGAGSFFVVEADEYDTAFFDKRAKFVHYRPRTLILNNLEFDHADIFASLAEIQRQFHYLLRTVPGEGRIVHPAALPALEEVFAMGCWTPSESISIAPEVSACWQAKSVERGGQRFEIWYEGQPSGALEWDHGGLHNVSNALAAIAAARHAGVPADTAMEALGHYRGVARRMQQLFELAGVRLFDDFAHHPTAITTTLAGLRAAAPGRRLVAILEPRSNTMKMGVHRDRLAAALAPADRVFLFDGGQLKWQPRAELATLGDKLTVSDRTEPLIKALVAGVQAGDDIVIMSNGGFEGLPTRLVTALKAKLGAGSKASVDADE